MSMRDLKSLGLPRDRAPMSDRGWNFCLGLVAVIFMLAVYGLVIDEPDRMVVMSRAAFERAQLDARIAGAREAFSIAQQDQAEVAAKRCTWQDLFTDPRTRKGPM